MWYVFVGFMLVVVVETLIRLLKGYEPEERRQPKHVEVSSPWYAWGLLGLFTFGLLRRNKKRK